MNNLQTYEMECELHTGHTYRTQLFMSEAQACHNVRCAQAAALTSPNPLNILGYSTNHRVVPGAVI